MKTNHLLFIVLLLIFAITVFTSDGCKKQDISNDKPPTPVLDTEPAQTAAQDQETPVQQVAVQQTPTQEVAATQPEQTNDVAVQVKPAPNQNKITEGYAFPNLEFTSFTGEKINIADYKGKVVLIDFWAAWCGPCRNAMPDVIKIYKQYHDKGFDIIGISLDRSQEQFETYIKENGITWQQYYDGLYWDNKIAKRFGIQAIPHITIIDKNGAVYFNTDYDKGKQPLRGNDLAKVIDKLCSEPAN